MEDSAKQASELGSLRGSEIASERVFHRVDTRAQSLEFRDPRRAERQGVLPAVVGVTATFDETSTLKTRDEVRDGRAVEVQLVSECALACAGPPSKHCQYAELHARDL